MKEDGESSGAGGGGEEVEILNGQLANVSPFTFHTFIIAFSY